MSSLPHAGHDDVYGKLLTLFPKRVPLARDKKISHEQIKQAVVTLVVVHRRLELFSETVEAAEAA